MPLSVPLAVRLKTARGDRHVTRDLRDLTFRSTAPGGFASCTLALNRPLSTQPDEIDYYASLYVYDRRSGTTVWEGRLEDPGRTASDGEVWTVQAVGPAAHTHDITRPLIYIDQSISAGWARVRNVAPGIQVGVGADPGNNTSGDQAIVIQDPQGLTVATNDAGAWQYQRIQDAGQKLARIDYTWDAGATTASRAVEALCRTDGGTGETARTQTWNTAGGGSSPKVVVTDWTNGRNTLDIRSIYTGAGATVGDDITWASIRNLFILAMRYNADGTEKTSGYSTNSVLASEVVNDLLGRLLTKFDGAGASVATTAYAIDSLAYPDSADAAKVLDDLMLLEPAYFWAAWESSLATSLYRFEWSAWPTAVRYEATVDDGFDSPGSAADLYNAVRVIYDDVAGHQRNVQRTQTVQSLTNAGLTREGFLDLRGSQIRSAGGAQRAGDQWLAERATPPNAGTLIVARPILDLTSGRTVMPWEIRPGNLIRVRGVLPRVDALNATARDGVTIFRVVAAEFRASSATATLELDSYPLTVARALAKLAKGR
jgi:hypothetical protein